MQAEATGVAVKSSVAAQHGQGNNLRPLLQPHLHRLRRVTYMNERAGYELKIESNSRSVCLVLHRELKKGTKL